MIPITLKEQLEPGTLEYAIHDSKRKQGNKDKVFDYNRHEVTHKFQDYEKRLISSPTTLGAVNSKSKGAYGSVLFLDDPNQLVLIGMVWYHFWALFGHSSKDVARPLIQPSYRNRAYAVNSIKYIGFSSTVGDREAER